MNKISIYALTFFLSLSSVTVYSQKNNKQVIFTNEQGSDIFYHTIERGQTVYAIATMYGVSVEDIYRLNPESKEGIKAGSTLRIPQKDSAIAPSGKADNYTYHTIQPKETLYSLSIKYSVPATDIIAANPGLSTSTFTIGKNIRSRRHDWNLAYYGKKDRTEGNGIYHTEKRDHVPYLPEVRYFQRGAFKTQPRAEKRSKSGHGYQDTGSQ